MATTRESIDDALQWLGRLGMVWLRRGTVIGVCIALFALAVWFTGRETFGDCSEFTDLDRAPLNDPSGLGLPDGLSVADAGCVRGVYAAALGGLSTDLALETARLEAAGWVDSGTLLPLRDDLRVECLRSDAAGLGQTELFLFASRAGELVRAEVRVTDEPRACEEISCASISTGCDRWDRLEGT